MEALTSNRRTLLWRGLLLIGGALGLTAAERRSGRRSVPLGSDSATLRLYGRGWRPQAPLLSRRVDSDHRVGYGDLLDAADGVVVGRFSTNGFCPDTPFGRALATSPTLEFQTLALSDGTVFGIGAAGLHAASEPTYAIVGGTGRFAGARGTYSARAVSGESGNRDVVEFTLTLTA